MSVQRLVICGAPRAGKSTMAQTLHMHGTWVYHLDTLVASHGWSEQSDAAARYLDEPGAWVVEGCAAVRALRKWLRAHETGKPCDAIVRMTTPRETLTKGQATLMKGEATIWAEIEGDLISRGVMISYV